MFKPDFNSLQTNPILIKRKTLGLTIAQLSRESKVALQVLRDLESGLPKNIPDSLLKYFDIHSPGSNLDTQYNEWKKAKRNLVFLPPVGILSMSSQIHPLEQYRNKIKISVSSLCDYLCLPRFVLLKYEQAQKRMPASLRNALPQAHLSLVDVDKLANMGEMFYLARDQRLINEQAHSR